MGEWLISVAGTPEGFRLAAILALASAFAHALFGALQKGRHDPWLSRGAIDLWLVLLSIPAVMLVPAPTPRLMGIMIGVVMIHFVYKLTIAFAYERADFTVAYPIMRGTGPLLTVTAAMTVFHESFTPLQWGGVLALSGGILGLAALNLSQASPDTRRRLSHGLGWAFAAGIMVAIYTTYDAWGIRQVANPLTFVAWFFLLSSIDFAIIGAVLYRRQSAPTALGPLLARGLIGALVAYVSFGAVMIATRVGSVGQSAVLRETSTVIAALIGWALLGERPGPAKTALMGVIAAGAILVQVGH